MEMIINETRASLQKAAAIIALRDGKITRLQYKRIIADLDREAARIDDQNKVMIKAATQVFTKTIDRPTSNEQRA